MEASFHTATVPPFPLTGVIALPPSANVRHQFGAKRLQFLEDPLDDVSLSGEQRLGTAGVHAIERRLVERGWLHDTPCSELVDHISMKQNLRRGQSFGMERNSEKASCAAARSIPT